MRTFLEECEDCRRGFAGLGFRASGFRVLGFRVGAFGHYCLEFSALGLGFRV